MRLIGHGEGSARAAAMVSTSLIPPAFSGPRASRGRRHAGDINYASIYDSFTITVVMQLEDLGFCEKGKGGNLCGRSVSRGGKLPFNTDGGGLCNNHPEPRRDDESPGSRAPGARRSSPKVQVSIAISPLPVAPADFSGVRHAASTCILERW